MPNNGEYPDMVEVHSADGEFPDQVDVTRDNAQAAGGEEQ